MLVQQPVFPQARRCHVHECPDLGRRMSTFRVEYVDRHRRLLAVAEDDLQLPRKESRADLVMQELGLVPSRRGRL